MTEAGAASYAGDVGAVEAYRILSSVPASTLIDVRTQAEWAYVGAPDLSAIGKSVIFVEWQRFPAMQVDQGFAANLERALHASGVESGATLLFICRSGARSRQSAIAMTEAGWAPCLNVSDGFEGPLDPWGHRNVLGGWRAANLPWTQA